jgi:hypothetical protein
MNAANLGEFTMSGQAYSRFHLTPLLALGVAALLGACAGPGGSSTELAMSGNALPAGVGSSVSSDQDTDSRTFIPPEDITRNGNGQALMWRTGTPISEFGDSTF